MTVPPVSQARLEQYCRRHTITVSAPLGFGKDGTVWRTSVGTALKIHLLAESYATEVRAYIRLRERDIEAIAGFQIPFLLDFEHDLFAIEMSIVSPPYLLDFASAILDRPSDLIEDEGNTLDDLVRDRFGDRSAEILYLQQQLAERAGI
jgi:hypothetical protein